MIKNILNLERVTILKKTEQKSINGGSLDPVCPQFLPCWSNRDCPCGTCGVRIGDFYIDDLCAF